MKKSYFLLLILLTSFSISKGQCIADYSFTSNNLTTNFTDLSTFPPGAVRNYSWWFSDGTASSTQANPTHTFSQAGTYIVYLSIWDSANTCFDSTSYYVTVSLPPPSCPVSFTNQNVGVNVVDFFATASMTARSDLWWSFGDGNFDYTNNLTPTHTYNSSGSYVVQLSFYDSIANCFSSYTDSILVGICHAGFTIAVNQDQISLTNSVASQLYTSMIYDFGDGNTSTNINPVHRYTQSGSYTITQTVYDTNTNCIGTFGWNQTITVPQCSANFSLTSNQNSVSISNLASNYDMISYDFGDGTISSLENPTHTYTQSGTYLICQTVFDTIRSCTDTFCLNVQITVPPPCRANFISSVSNDTLRLIDSAKHYTRILYSFGDGDSSQLSNPTRIYQQSGTYQVCQTVWNDSTNCTDTYCDSITIIKPPKCIADFSAVVSNDTLFVTDSAEAYTRILYTFGDGDSSNLSNPIHIYQQSGTYQVCQTVWNDSTNCTDTFCDSVTIIKPPKCIADFSAVVSNDTLFVTDSAEAYTRILYTFGDGDSSNLPKPIHIYQQSGTYQVCQTVWNDLTNCSDTFCDTIVVVRPPDCSAGFSVQQIADTVFFSSTAVGYERITYYFGDGDSSTQSNPSHQYAQSGQYIVRQEVFNDSRNCSDSFFDTLTVNISSSCFAEFQIAIDTNRKNTLYLINTSSKVNSHIYSWDFGDGGQGSGRTPIHNYQDFGKYNICLTISDQALGCWSQTCEEVGLDSLGNVLKSTGFTLRVLDGSFIGIEEESEDLSSTIKAYPNPFLHSITIESKTDQLNYEVYSTSGQVIRKGRITTKEELLDLSELEKGIYFIRFSNEKDAVVKKVIKK